MAANSDMASLSTGDFSRGSTLGSMFGSLVSDQTQNVMQAAPISIGLGVQPQVQQVTQSGIGWKSTFENNGFGDINLNKKIVAAEDGSEARTLADVHRHVPSTLPKQAMEVQS